MSKMNFYEIVAGADNSRAMDPDTIQKNGASLKSLMSKINNFGKMCFALLAASIILFSINSCTNANVQSSNSKSEQWEYKVVGGNEWFRRDRYIVERKYESVKEELDSLGKEGWELVSVYGDLFFYEETMFTFKRRLP